MHGEASASRGELQLSGYLEIIMKFMDLPTLRFFYHIWLRAASEVRTAGICAPIAK